MAGGNRRVQRGKQRKTASWKIWQKEKTARLDARFGEGIRRRRELRFIKELAQSIVSDFLDRSLAALRNCRTKRMPDVNDTLRRKELERLGPLAAIAAGYTQSGRW